MRKGTKAPSSEKLSTKPPSNEKFTLRYQIERKKYLRLSHSLKMREMSLSPTFAFSSIIRPINPFTKLLRTTFSELDGLERSVRLGWIYGVRNTDLLTTNRHENGPKISRQSDSVVEKSQLGLGKNRIRDSEKIQESK